MKITLSFNINIAMNITSLIYRWDVKLPVVLDFEIWKASNMLFQSIPRETDEGKWRYSQTSNWNDFWHKTFPDEIEPSMIKPQKN